MNSRQETMLVGGLLCSHLVLLILLVNVVRHTLKDIRNRLRPCGLLAFEVNLETAPGSEIQLSKDHRQSSHLEENNKEDGNEEDGETKDENEEYGVDEEEEKSKLIRLHTLIEHCSNRRETVALGLSAIKFKRRFHAEHVGLSFLPTEIASMKYLVCLSAENMNLESVPGVVGQLLELRELSLSLNRLTRLPPELGQLRKLKKLVLRCNQFSDIPSIVGAMGGLQSLDLSANNLGGLLEPSQVFSQLSSTLTELNLSINRIEELPLAMGELRMLSQLDLSCNNLKEIPFNISAWSEMTTLRLWGNRFKRLPIGIHMLHCLERLDFSCNPIDVVPFYLLQLIAGEVEITAPKKVNQDGRCLFLDLFTEWRRVEWLKPAFLTRRGRAAFKEAPLIKSGRREETCVANVILKFHQTVPWACKVNILSKMETPWK